MRETERFEDLIKTLRPRAYPLIVEAVTPQGEFKWRAIISSPRMADRFRMPAPVPGTKLQLSDAFGEVHEL